MAGFARIDIGNSQVVEAPQGVGIFQAKNPLADIQRLLVKGECFLGFVGAAKSDGQGMHGGQGAPILGPKRLFIAFDHAGECFGGLGRLSSRTQHLAQGLKGFERGGMERP